MTSKEHIQHLMREIGPQLNLAAVTEFDEELWVLTFDEATVIEADFDATFGKLVLASTIAPAMEGSEAQLYPLLLQYNYAWETDGRGTDGAGWAGRSSAVMVIDVPIGELDFQKLQTVLINLGAQVCHWRAVLQSMSNTTPPPRAMEIEGDSQFLGSSLRI